MMFEYRGSPGASAQFIEASGPTDARRILDSRGLFHQRLKPLRPLGLATFWSLVAALAELLKQGLPIHQSLQMVERSPSRKLSEGARRIHFYLKAGRPLTESLQCVFPSLPPHVGEMLSVGEASASLDRTLQELCLSHRRQKIELEKIQEALVYPSIVLITAVIVCWILFDHIVPGFSGLLSSDSSQSKLTMLVFGLAGRVGPAIEFTVWCTVAVLSLSLMSSRYQITRLFVEQVTFNTPGLRGFVISRERNKFLSVWSMGLSAGLPVERALGFASSAVNNAVLRELLNKSMIHIRAGMPVDAALRDTSLFKPDELFRLHLGLEVGSIADAVDQVSVNASREALHRLRVLTNLAGPIAIILLGIAVGAIAFGILVPIFSLQSAINIGT
jgi:type IV pilus assembly protein PilC